MHPIEPDMVLGKALVDGQGGSLGEIVDVGLWSHGRVKYLLVEDRSQRVPIRTVGVDDIEQVSADAVRVRVR